MGVDGFVLAGGRSRRMGSDKARAPYRGLPLAIATAVSMRVVCLRVAIVRRRDDGLPWPLPHGGACEVVFERVKHEEHPLWGVVTSLRAAQTELVAIAPCDVPGITPRSWERLLENAPAVASDGSRASPLIAVLPRTLATAAEALARSGAPAWRLADGLARVEIPTEELADHDDPSSLGEGPIRRMLSRIGGALPPAAQARVIAGERGRLAARGMVDPGS